MSADTLITIGYYLSSVGFLAAFITMGVAVQKFGKSSLASIFYYLFIGTGIFFVITVFQKLGGDFFGIGDTSMDFWWHLMFYMAFFFYFQGIKLLVNLGNADAQQNQMAQIDGERKWGVGARFVLVVVFIIPKFADGIVTAYMSSPFADFGLHHFLAFAVAAAVGFYLLHAEKNLGQIGKAIANPMIVAMWAFAGQHFWELLVESWKVIQVTSETGEGVEKIFLVIAAISITYAAWRLNSFAKAS